MTEISRLKYIQWRPIGVCDTGAGKERKAKMFSRLDLASITAPEVKRENWRQHPKVMALITRYAQDVAELSTLTNGMRAPEIDEIKLVGAVLGHDQTPNLNQESEDGRVQFFQVSFRDVKSKKTSTKKWKKLLKWILIAMGVLIGIILIILLSNRLSLLTIKNPQQYASVCSSNRQQAAYAEELRKIRKSLGDELNQLPEWLTFKQARVNCSGGRISVNQQELRLLRCLLTVRNRTNNMSSTAHPKLNQIEACAGTLCKRNLPHLASLCKRL